MAVAPRNFGGFMFATFQQDNQITIDESASSKRTDFPFTYQSFQLSTGFRPVGFRYSKYITEISADLDGHEIVVCGESEIPDIDCQKAFQN